LNEVNLLALSGEGKAEGSVTKSSLKKAKEAAKKDLKNIKDRRSQPSANQSADPVELQSSVPVRDEVLESNPELTSTVSDIDAAEIYTNLNAQGGVNKISAMAIATAIQEGTLEDLSVEDVKTRTADRYSAILREIEKLATGDGVNTGRIFTISVSAEHLKKYFEEYGSIATSTGKQKQMADAPGTPSSEPKKISKPPEIKPKPTPAATPSKAMSSINMKTIIEAPLHETEQLIDIPYVFFGDILTAILRVAKTEIGDRRIKFLLGNMVYKGRDNKKVIISLADVPISIRTYSAWFHKNYVKKLVSNVPLQDFIRRMITELVSPALGRRCFRDAGTLPPGHNRVSIHHFTSKSELRPGRLLGSEIMGKLSSGRGKKSSRYNYVVINSQMTPSTLTGNPRTDTPEIFHLYLGRDRGLLKDANFSKIDNPNLVAHLMTKEMGGAIERAKEPYNVDLTMIGNNFLRPGVLFHLTPTVPGSSSIKLAKNLGVGGYYRVLGIQGDISPSGFVTTVRGRWESEAGTGGRFGSMAIASIRGAQQGSNDVLTGQKIK